MAFEDILKQIREDGERAVAEIRNESTAATEKVLAQARREADRLRQQLMERARQRAEERAERLLTLAELDHRKAVLAEKQRLISEAFTAARERLARLSPTETANMLQAVVRERLETGHEEIVPGRLHANVVDAGFVSALNASLGPRGHLRLAAAPGDFDHGVVLREGRMEINIRLDVLLAEAREQLAHAIAQELFEAAHANA